MSKKKLSAVLIVVAIILVVIAGLIFYYGQPQVNDDLVTSVNQEQLTANYITQVQALLPLYERLFMDKAVNQDILQSLREQMLALKMPADFRDAHVALVLLLDQVEDNALDKEGLAESLSIIKDKYPWLKQ